MALNHGRLAVVLIDSVDISAFTNTAEMADESDLHDVTCFGAVRKAYFQGLGDGTFTIGGVHDSGASGPRKKIKAVKAGLVAVTFQYRPAGTGAGKQQSSVSVFVKSYVDTISVADVVRWKSVLQMTGALDETDQS
jgi:hypothetical protein